MMRSLPALPIRQRGKIIQAVGTLAHAKGVESRIGDVCRLTRPDGVPIPTAAEVVGFSGDTVILSMFGGLQTLEPGTLVEPTGKPHAVQVGDFLLGRIVDAMGEHYLEDGQVITGGLSWPVDQFAPLPTERPRITEPLWTGVRVIDAMMTCGNGQRLGVFAPAGCGKTTLLSMICAHSEAEVIVVALVGERGREVADFVEHAVPPERRGDCVVVVATSDRSAGERLKAAFVATSYAEYFRSQGRSVLLLVDSVTRLARAAREISLAAGEPPARKGYPPSVFSLLPRLFERAGTSRSGTITAFYTVLEDGENETDPISEEVRSLLDGHIVLSRKLANKGHFPAIDVLASLSRLMKTVVTEEQDRMANRLREWLSQYNEIELLIRLGEYRPGFDAKSDVAVKKAPELEQFFRQELGAFADSEQILWDMRQLTEVDEPEFDFGEA
jgi:ATP synthase in type III secretion protein N